MLQKFTALAGNMGTCLVHTLNAVTPSLDYPPSHSTPERGGRLYLPNGCNMLFTYDSQPGIQTELQVLHLIEKNRVDADGFGGWAITSEAVFTSSLITLRLPCCEVATLHGEARYRL